MPRLILCFCAIMSVDPHQHWHDAFSVQDIPLTSGRIGTIFHGYNIGA